MSALVLMMPDQDDGEGGGTNVGAGLLVLPERLWAAQEIRENPSPLPASPGVYGWWFEEPLGDQLPADRLLYVGIAPRRMSGRASRQNLRSRVRYHYRGRRTCAASAA